MQLNFSDERMYADMPQAGGNTYAWGAWLARHLPANQTTLLDKPAVAPDLGAVLPKPPGVR